MAQKRRLSTVHISRQKGKNIVVCLTAYTAPMARILDDKVDLLLVGDSLGMVIYGHKNTLRVTTELMIAHGSAVVSSTQHACIIVDLPFGTYQESPQVAYRTAAKILAETGCSGVKLEGGSEMSETIRYLVERGIPVMGHIGLTPQHFNSIGGFIVQGKNKGSAEKLVDDATELAHAGAFAIVAEAMPPEVGAAITKATSVPIIGIGAGKECDGQILITEDIIGLSGDFLPKFVKRYADVGSQIRKGIDEFVSEVQEGTFPDSEHSYLSDKSG